MKPAVFQVDQSDGFVRLILYPTPDPKPVRRSHDGAMSRSGLWN